MAAALGPKKIAQINDKYLKYIDETDIPIVAEFAYKNDLARELLYQNSTLSHTTKKCILKKEANLERKCLSGEIDKTMAIFSLKQLGWKDTQAIDHTVSAAGTLKIVRKRK